MKLTNTIKRELAMDITVAAASKHAPALVKLAEKLHKQWRDAYIAHFITMAPTLAKESWSSLIQTGVLNSCSNHGTVQVAEYDPLEGYPNRVVSESISACHMKHKGELRGKDHYSILSGRVKAVFKGIPMLSAYGRDHYREFNVSVNTTDKCHDIPGASCVVKLDRRYDKKNDGDNGFVPTPEGRAWYNLASPLIKPTQDLVNLYLKVFVEADAYHQHLLEALESVSQSSQLIELFPEAAQFLPEPPAPKSKIVPANLFADARKMLEEGIPT